MDFVKGVPLLSAYDVQAWKPRPDLFLHAAELLGIEPRYCAVIEDSQFGVEAGVNAGMQVFAFDPESKLTEHSHIINRRVRMVRELSELIPILGD